MSIESQRQALQNLENAIKRCQQERGMRIWDATSAITDAIRVWAEQEKLEVKVTVVSK
jgi:hypothetical protein